MSASGGDGKASGGAAEAAEEARRKDERTHGVARKPMPSPRREVPPAEEKVKRSVLILYTGGTFGMVHNEAGALVPSKGVLRSILADMWELSRPESPSYDLLEWEDPKDSSDFDPVCWQMLADQISKHYYSYDGFVVLHGTDTMAYTASALSFMLANLAKPVVLTGAVIPLGEVYNDAKRNLIVSTLVAAQGAVPEVCVFFNDGLFRGNRCKKVDPDALAAFDSPNFPKMATIGPSVQFNASIFRPAPVHPFKALTYTFSDIIVVSLTPGFSDSFLLDLAHAPRRDGGRGLVLSLYGYGNAPVNKKGFLEALKMLIEAGFEVVVASQCLRGRTSLSTYATGRALLGLGLIEAGDMTLEATVTKLSFLMGSGLRGPALAQAMQADLRGELTANGGNRREWENLGPTGHALAQSFMRDELLRGGSAAALRPQAGAAPQRQCQAGECALM